MKTRQDNDVTDRTDAVYAENQNELPCLIGLGAIYEENNTWQRCDKSYKSSLHQNQNYQNWTFGTYMIGCGMWWKLDRKTMWPIVQVRPTLKTILNYC